MSVVHRISPRLAAVAVGLVLLTSCSSDTIASGESTGVVTAGLETYTIGTGDTLSSIASRSGISLADLIAANGWADGTDHLIVPGDVIALPAGASALSPRQPASDAAPAKTGSAAPASGTAAPSSPSGPSCDEGSIASALDGETAIESFACDGVWAGANVLDFSGVYYSTIFSARENFWVMQNWETVCDENDLPPSVVVYCRGG